MDSQQDMSSGLSQVSHLPAGSQYSLQGFRLELIFLYNYFVTGEDDKAVFLFLLTQLVSLQFLLHKKPFKKFFLYEYCAVSYIDKSMVLLYIAVRLHKT
jgi:hypothetical protein